MYEKREPRYRRNIIPPNLTTIPRSAPAYIAPVMTPRISKQPINCPQIEQKSRLGLHSSVLVKRLSPIDAGDPTSTWFALLVELEFSAVDLGETSQKPCRRDPLKEQSKHQFWRCFRLQSYELQAFYSSLLLWKSGPQNLPRSCYQFSQGQVQERMDFRSKRFRQPLLQEDVKKRELDEYRQLSKDTDVWLASVWSRFVSTHRSLNWWEIYVLKWTLTFSLTTIFKKKPAVSFSFSFNTFSKDEPFTSYKQHFV